MQRIPAKRLPFILAGGTIFFAVLFAYRTYGEVPPPGGVSWTLEWNEPVHRGMHVGSRAEALHKAFKGAGGIPEPSVSLEGEYTYAEPSSICTFVSDDREFIAPSDLGLDDPTFLRTQLPALSQGRSVAFYLNMLWTIRHRQRLTRLVATKREGWHGSWAKHANMLKMADDRSCKWLIYLDTDVYIREQKYSFHDLRLRWGIHDGILLAASGDAYNATSRYNAGFLIMQNNPELKEMIDDWMSCPDKIKDCEKFKLKPMHDQAVLNDFIVPKLIVDGTIREIPCSEATGNTAHAANPAMSDWFVGEPLLCEGLIVTHSWWHGKEHLMQEATQLLAHNLLLVLEDAIDPAWI